MSSAPEIVETERLRAERARPEHRAEFERLLTDPVAVATLGGLPGSERIDALFSRACSHWDEHGFGMWLCFERGGGRHVGHAGLLYTETHGLRDVELAYALLPEAWGCGYAGEIARALVDVAFGPLGLPTLVAMTLPTNVGSRLVMERAGFGYERDFQKQKWLHVLYRRFA